MIDFSLQEILSNKNYQFAYKGVVDNLAQSISGVSIDTRTLRSHELYFAIRGENLNGHDFVQEALNKQAAAVVVEEKWWHVHKATVKNRPVFVVKNTVTALQKLANTYRKKFTLPVIALTGTNGKTTTKEMLAAVLSSLGSVCKTAGNLNNHIGLPLTLLTLDANHKILIVEMGANHFSEIDQLCEIAEPNYGLITNIGHGHLEFFQSLEGVAKAKMELFEYLSPHGTVFINIDDPMIVNHAPEIRNSIKYGFRDEAMVFAEPLPPSDSGYPRMKVQEEVLTLNVMGEHNLSNALSAVAVGLEFGLSLDKIKKALLHVRLPGKRMEVFRHDDILIINDSYNANPDSTLAALQILKQTQVQGRKFFVFGDMLELGKLASREHAKIGQVLTKYGVDMFFAFGPESLAAVQTATKQNKNIFAQHFSDKQDLIDNLKKQLKEKDLLLVKGSRGMKMEEVIDALFKSQS